VNRFYDACPAIVQRTMDRFANLTGRSYRLFDYYGAPDAERVIVIMGSGAEAAEEAVDALNKSGKPRADLLAILLTGIPSGLIPGFQNFTGKVQADLMRLNTAIPPSPKPSIYGLLGGDLAGFPNGRRVFDDVVSVELRAIAGATYPLVNPAFTPDAAAGLLTDGLTPASVTAPFLTSFPYLGVPYDGYHNPS